MRRASIRKDGHLSRWNLRECLVYIQPGVQFVLPFLPPLLPLPLDRGFAECQLGSIPPKVLLPGVISLGRSPDTDTGEAVSFIAQCDQAE